MILFVYVLLVTLFVAFALFARRALASRSRTFASFAFALGLTTLALTALACRQPDEPPPSSSTPPPQTVQNVWLGIVGDTADAPHGATEFGLTLMGGSADVDEAMRWMLTRAGGGDVVVLRASGGNGYNDYLFNLGAKVNSVETLLINTREKADNPEIERRVRNAEMVFIAGGDQANYVNFWRNTRLHAALTYLATVKKIPIGGTSAGCAILGGLYFSALEGTIRSEEALANPFDPRITIGRHDFLAMPFLTNTITDTHYDNPDRTGRHLTFMARIAHEEANASPRGLVRGIGVEERTAACINDKGVAVIFGSGRAHFLWQNGETSRPEECAPLRPLTWNRNREAARSYIIRGSSSGAGSFDCNDWAAGAKSGGIAGFYSVQNGVLSYRQE
jgi:cyanophycinase-like exopeptidase